MKGSSGAILDFKGDFLRKTCKDAKEQCEWFYEASRYPLVPGIRLPFVNLLTEEEYELEWVEGFCGTCACSTRTIDTLVEQVLLWSKIPSAREADWSSYISRLYSEHVSQSDSEIIRRVFEVFDENLPLPSSFSHGDLTLENVLIEKDGGIVLIDPNYKTNLFQSFVLDLGKILQSVHSDYHRLFNSHPGSDPRSLCEHLKGRLGPTLWKQSLLAELSHVVRLRKYRTASEWPIVDKLLHDLLTNYEQST